MKVVTRIDGHVVLRPAASHPRPEYWMELKRNRSGVQLGFCATCWRHESNHPLDLHHRHYVNFGAETLHCVVLLCRACHEAITSRIRDERYAMGDRSVDTAPQISHAPPHKPCVTELEAVEFRAETIETRFRPSIRRETGL